MPFPTSSSSAAASSSGGGGDDDDTGVPEWTLGLPSDADLTPLSHLLVPAALAAAFSITPEPPRTALDVHRASHASLSALRCHSSVPSAALKPFLADDPMILDPTDPEPEPRRPHDDPRDTNSSDNDPSARTLKRPRLVWTPQLHKRFVDVVAHLGIKNSVPKTIMQLMNVEGLTRENVASHLQKYRLYLKRMQGLSSEGPSSSDHLFASTPVPQSLHEPAPMPYAVPAMIPMPVFNMGHHGGSPVGMVPVSNQSPGAYRGLEQHHYGGFGEAPKDWSAGNSYRAVVSYPRVTPSDK